MRTLRSAAILAAALAFVAGLSDAVAYLRWHQFGANMTGNTVLAGISFANANLANAGVALQPIGAFVAGCAVAQALVRRSRIVTVGVAALMLFAASLVGHDRWGLALIAAAMGITNTAVSTFENVSANTSFVTGDYGRIAQAAMRLLTRAPEKDDRKALAIMSPIVVAYAAGGAVAATLVNAHFGHALPIGAAILIAVAMKLSKEVRQTPAS